jgi:DNA-binding transcriptional MerR regulator
MANPATVRAYAARCSIVLHLRERGRSIQEVKAIMRMTPEEVRRHEARARRNANRRAREDYERAMY